MTFTVEQKKHIMRVKLRIFDEVSRIFDSQYWYDSKNQNWNQVYLTGGAIASIIQGQEPNDWDFYFKDSVTMNSFTKSLTVDKLDHVGDVNPKYDHVLIKGKAVTPKAITMKSGHSFIVMMYGSPEDVRGTFDYKHCMPYYACATGTLFISEEQYLAALNKRLVVNNQQQLKYYRQDKFLNRGYSIDDKDKLIATGVA